MTDEKTTAAVERLRGIRLESTSTFDQDAIATILAALDTANERAERECVWMWRWEDPDSQFDGHYIRLCDNDYGYRLVPKFCPNCGGRVVVKEAK